MSTWTVAFRDPRANRFLRYSGLSLNWQAAVDYAERLATVCPNLQVWYTTTAEYDRTHPNEDSNNILTDTGRRVRVFETDSLPDGAPAVK